VSIRFEALLPTLLALMALAGVLWLVSRLAARAVRRAAAKLEIEGLADEAQAWATRITALVRHALQALVVLVATVVMVRAVGVPGVAQVTLGAFVTWLTGPGLRILLVVGSAYVLARAVQFLVENLQLVMLSRSAPEVDRGERRKRIATVGNMLALVATVLIASVAGVTVLALLGVDIRPILTGAGIAGLAVGFGAQNLVRDVIAGFFLILEDQVRVGDVVSINGKGGLVEQIHLRTISLRGLDGTVHIIPNGAITELSNQTKDFSYAVLDLGVAYKEDVDRVMDVLREVGADLQGDPAFSARVLEPIEILGVDAFADSAVVIKTRIKTLPIQQWAVGRELRRRIKIAFDARGIEIPFPHVSVYFGEASKPFAVRPAETSGASGVGSQAEGPG